MEIVYSLEDFLLIKGVTKTSESETKEPKDESLGMLLGTLGAILLGNILACKGIFKTSHGVVQAGDVFMGPEQHFQFHLIFQ